MPLLEARTSRDPEDGSESLGAHCEGPFLNPEKNGIHKKEALQTPSSYAKLEACYGSANLYSPRVRMVTFAPELDQSKSVIKGLKSKGIVASIGHSTATHNQATSAVKQGATMITHMYNAMPQPHHRDTGIVGILGAQEGISKPYFGIIADGIHVHPNMVQLAYSAHPKGCILVTDAMSVLGLPDGDYPWTNGEIIEKRGPQVTLKGQAGKLAGR